jgi:hypothetical protein
MGVVFGLEGRLLIRKSDQSERRLNQAITAWFAAAGSITPRAAAYRSATATGRSDAARDLGFRLAAAVPKVDGLPIRLTVERSG